jgi:hypothetical protein
MMLTIGQARLSRRFLTPAARIAYNPHMATSEHDPYEPPPEDEPPFGSIRLPISRAAERARSWKRRFWVSLVVTTLSFVAFLLSNALAGESISDRKADVLTMFLIIAGLVWFIATIATIAFALGWAIHGVLSAFYLRVHNERFWTVHGRR